MQADMATHLLKKKYPNSYRATIYQKDHAIAILSHKETKIVVDPWKGVFLPYQKYKEYYFKDAEIRKVW